MTKKFAYFSLPSGQSALFIFILVASRSSTQIAGTPLHNADLMHLLAQDVDLLVQEMDLLAYLENMANANDVYALLSQLGDFAQQCQILVGIEAVLACLASWLKQSGSFKASQHLGRQSQQLRNDADSIFWEVRGISAS